MVFIFASLIALNMLDESNNEGEGNFPPKPPSQEEIIRLDDELVQDLNNTQTDDEDIVDQSNFDNIIPMEQLKHGWLAISSLVASTATKIQAKAVETYNSETVQTYRQKTAEVVAPAWQKVRSKFDVSFFHFLRSNWDSFKP